DCGTSERGQPFFVMELVKGIALTDYCEQHRLPLRDRLLLMRQVCSAVQHAHQKGVVHRDLKPSNVLVSDEGGKPQVKVIDFGLAKAMGQRLVDVTFFTALGSTVGTPEYMSPEQADATNADVDTRADIYSLGVMLYEVLVGSLPFSGEQLRRAGLLEMQRLLREVEPPKPSTRLSSLAGSSAAIAAGRQMSAGELQRALKNDLDWVVGKAMEKERSRRYETANALSADLQRFLDHEPLVAGPPSAGYRLKKLVRRYRGQVIAGSLVLLALIGGGIGTFVQYLRAEQKAEENAKLLVAAEAEANKNRIFADVARLAEARRREAELYPAFPEEVSAMQSWILNFGEPLAARLPKLEHELADLRARAKPATEAQRRAAWEADARWPELRRRLSELQQESDTSKRDELHEQIRTLENEIAVTSYDFEDPMHRYLHRTLTQLVHELGEFVQRGKIADVKARLVEAQTVQQRTIDAHRTQWSEAIAAIAGSDDVRASRLYENLALTPQTGLVPIGMDQESKLWEFVHLGSGATGAEIPARDPVTSRLLPTGEMGIVFVLLPGGLLPVEDGMQPDHRHSVRLDAFFLSKYEMTQGQWMRLGGASLAQENRETDKRNNPALPVEYVNWFDCTELLRKHGLVLPSELRWEYACRGGTKTTWWTGATSPWWTGAPMKAVAAKENIGRKPSTLLIVGSCAPNPFGLFDIGGNVTEWCLDDYGDYGTERVGDGLRPELEHRTSDGCMRGGNYLSAPSLAPSNVRINVEKASRYAGGAAPRLGIPTLNHNAPFITSDVTRAFASKSPGW
ncbi:MAG: SUMF1/EgtB/PvdO family nonheme iron enzyme, partial [Planctomycetota bacterium]